MTDIQDALRQFNLADFHDELDAGERERSEMVARFPLTSWENMSLEQYALGQSRPKEDVYCWWLEFGTPHLGNIGGATAIKHMIFTILTVTGNISVNTQMKTKHGKRLIPSFSECLNLLKQGSGTKLMMKLYLGGVVERS